MRSPLVRAQVGCQVRHGLAPLEPATPDLPAGHAEFIQDPHSLFERLQLCLDNLGRILASRHGLERVLRDAGQFVGDEFEHQSDTGQMDVGLDPIHRS